MTVYYNEIDPYAAQWLRNLIDAGHIAPGIVDERSIEDVYPSDLRGFTQCHFFAGIGVWSLALRRAGWSDDRPIWTGSCPCQPFSAAGKGDGFADERHLWPAFHHLIRECKPAVVAGEQVASRDVDPWIDLVQVDLEAVDYAVGAVAFPSAGVGAPHIRDRTYWVAHAHDARLEGRRRAAQRAVECATGTGVLVGGLADTNGSDGGQGSWLFGRERPAQPVQAGGMADSHGWHAGAERQQRCGEQRQQSEDGGVLQDGPTGPTNGLWRAADWLACRDGRWRPVEPGTFPLVNGASARMGRGRPGWQAPAGKEGFGHREGRLRAYGNAINAEAARVFIEAVMEAA